MVKRLRRRPLTAKTGVRFPYESMELAWKAFLTKGKPAKLQMACVIASQQGVAHMAELFPGDDVTLWCAAIDPVLDEHKYIVPGLGDAGDLSFGEKL